MKKTIWVKPGKVEYEKKTIHKAEEVKKKSFPFLLEEISGDGEKFLLFNNSCKRVASKEEAIKIVKDEEILNN